MKRLSPDEALAVFEQLEAFGWLTREGSKVRRAPSRWFVNPVVHQKFAEKGKAEAERRAEVRRIIAEVVGTGGEP
ncbi:hypothetical protein [Bradyrhizobium sp. STM 3809]|uniref:hypothetical protein n=1 Tax=Bradyrhizobium sp. STM 3809 TaxID=551936 RepID=UPI00024075EF|nr:hypothetical protein [Bradyrhizobium sp. STM 3809]CCD97737.1 hypothetical protein BRAS3809_130004 [Bradyrhizobium sp. STM 3809]